MFLPPCQRPSFTSIQNNRKNYSSISIIIIISSSSSSSSIYRQVQSYTELSVRFLYVTSYHEVSPQRSGFSNHPDPPPEVRETEGLLYSPDICTEGQRKTTKISVVVIRAMYRVANQIGKYLCQHNTGLLWNADFSFHHILKTPSHVSQVSRNRPQPRTSQTPTSSCLITTIVNT